MPKNFSLNGSSTFQLGGMKEGDFIVSIGDKDVKWASHDQVVRLIKHCGDSISLKLVTPMDRNYLKVRKKKIKIKILQRHKNTKQVSSINY